jgi:hypothetical protein
LPRKITERWRVARLRLAQKIAPPGADVHDPDDTICPSLQGLLEAVFWNRLQDDAGERRWLDVTDWLDELAAAGLVLEPDDQGQEYLLTRQGAQELARLWGPERVPPWWIALSRGAGNSPFRWPLPTP